jgi:DNA-binding GntR family transcriptional regulator
MAPSLLATSRRAARPDIVYRRLRELIVRGQLAPGARLVEADIARRLSVSRTPVRGALQRLQQEGYIVDTPSLRQSRPFVAPLTADDMRELFHIVAEVEGLAARYCAALPVLARKALAEDLRTINDTFRRTANAHRRDHNALWECDERFHRRYVEASKGVRVIALHDVIKPQAERYERLYVSLLSDAMRQSIVEHNRIARAIATGDPEDAQQAVQANWRNAAVRLGDVIADLGERGSW